MDIKRQIVVVPPAARLAPSGSRTAWPRRCRPAPHPRAGEVR
jgi:hypothetical protein